MREIDVIDAIRSEASGAKQCFTQYSFQSLAIASTVLGISLGAMGRVPGAAYAPLPAIALLMAVSRMSIFKYATANRNCGYELHLARTERLNYAFLRGEKPRWRSEMRELAWEEAVRAWRVVQPTLFRAIYRTPEETLVGRWLEENHLGWVNWFRGGLYHLHPSVAACLAPRCGSNSGYPWFLPQRLASSVNRQGRPNAVYYAGSYLRTILSVLAFTQLLMLLPLFLQTLSCPALIPISILSSTFVLIVVRTLRITRRRTILEDELLSIHSCAIVWQAVVMAHFAAVDRTAGTYDHYTEYLAEEAQDIAEHATELHQWLGQSKKVG